MRKNKAKRRSDLLRKFHKGALKISIVEDWRITVGRKRNFFFQSKGNSPFPRISMRAFVKFGYRIANCTPSLNIKRRELNKKFREL